MTNPTQSSMDRLDAVCLERGWRYEIEDTGCLPRRHRARVEIGLCILEAEGRDRGDAARRILYALADMRGDLQG